jgi:hypothetical protein
MRETSSTIEQTIITKIQNPIPAKSPIIFRNVVHTSSRAVRRAVGARRGILMWPMRLLAWLQGTPIARDHECPNLVDFLRRLDGNRSW